MTDSTPDRPGFSLDLARCVGCGACVVACRMENRLPAGVSWRRVLQVNRNRIGGWPTYHLSVACHHCHEPPCARACPSGALVKGTDGLVLLNADRCIGCRYCEMACPFGAPSFHAESGLMTKCHLCHHRSGEGLRPACVEACPTQALDALRASTGGHPENPSEGEGPGLEPAHEIPGFGDAWDSGPGFRIAPPRGRLRSEWYLRLKNLMLPGGRERHGPA